jgi:hypothetical protein
MIVLTPRSFCDSFNQRREKIMRWMLAAVLFVPFTMIGFAAAGAEVIIKPGHVYSSKCVVDYLKSKGCKDCDSFRGTSVGYCKAGGPYFGDINKNYGFPTGGQISLFIEAEAACAGK